MRPDRAWVRLRSGKRLNLLDPTPDSWEDSDLAIGLSRAYRWGGHSCWDLPLSVAQHSLLVLVLRQQMQPHQPLSRGEALRELLHDGHEGFLSFDPIAPVKPHLGPEVEDVAGRCRQRSGAATACRPGRATTTCCTSAPTGWPPPRRRCTSPGGPDATCTRRSASTSSR